MALSTENRDRAFRHLRHAGLSKPATEAVLDELDALHQRIDALERLLDKSGQPVSS